MQNAHSRYLHLVPIEPGECLPSWILRIANRDTQDFQAFSSRWLDDDLRVTPGFDAFPAVSLLMQLGALGTDELDYYLTHHSLLGTTKPFYSEDEWRTLITTRAEEGTRIYTLRRKSKQQSWHICPGCRDEENRRGVLTFQVGPQIPGKLYCFTHKTRLALHTNTRIPPLAAPAANDIPLVRREIEPSVCDTENHLMLAQDIEGALTGGLTCNRSGDPLRGAIAKALLARTWSPTRIWSAMAERFGESFLEEAQIRTYHDHQSHLGRLHPSYHGIVYLALIARAFGTRLRDLLGTVHSTQ